MPDVPQSPADQLIEVPPLLPAFLTAASDWIADLAMQIQGGDFSGNTEQPWRANEDELAESMRLALGDRAVIVNALDDGMLVAADVIRFHHEKAVEKREGQLRVELLAWCAAHNIASAEAVAS